MLREMEENIALSDDFIIAYGHKQKTRAGDEKYISKEV
jgi:hypothetical protein